MYLWVVKTETEKIYYRTAKDVAKRYKCSTPAIFKRLKNEKNADTRVFGKDIISREDIDLELDGVVKIEKIQ